MTVVRDDPARAPSALQRTRSRGPLRGRVALLGPAFVAFGILALQQRGHRRFELAIAGFLAIVCLGFVYDLSQVSVDAGAFFSGFVPGFDGSDSVMLAVGILGATVMPHVVYLHGALVQHRIPPPDEGERRSLLRFQRVDVAIAMGWRG